MTELQSGVNGSLLSGRAIRGGGYANFCLISDSPFPEGIGPFLDSWLLLWPESIVLVIQNARFSTGCFFTISTGFWWSMRAGSRRSTASSGRSSRKSWSAIWTAGTPVADSPASAVLTVGKIGF